MFCKVFFIRKSSIPDVALSPTSRDSQDQCLYFDSIKSLPTTLPPHIAIEDQSRPLISESFDLDQDLVKQIAACLSQKLQLTLFGFDVIVASTNGDHLVVDINYFPNYKGCKDAPASLRNTLRWAHEAHVATVCDQ